MESKPDPTITKECIVCNLLKRSFACHDFVTKKQIVETGRPTPGIDFDATGKRCIRYFNPHLYNVYQWLAGCNHLQKLFCWPCLLFSRDTNAWSRHGFGDISHIKMKLIQHASSLSHLQAVICERTYINKEIGSLPDDQHTIHDSKEDEIVRNNRDVMKRFIDVVCISGSRGQDAVFADLVDLLSRYDYKLKYHLEYSSAFTGLSSGFQDNLIQSISSVVTGQLKHEVRESKFVTISLYDAAGAGPSSQLAVVMRSATDHGQVQERFVGFVDVPACRSADETCKILVDFIHEYSCEYTLVAYSLDGAAVRANEFRKLQLKMKEHFPNAVFVHCFGEKFSVVLSQALAHIKYCRIFFRTLTGLKSFFSKSRRSDNEEANKLMETVSSTLNNDNSCFAARVYQCRNELLSLLQTIVTLDGYWDHDTFVTACGLLSEMKTFAFKFLLHVFADLFPIIDNLFDTLQSTFNDIVINTNQANIFKDNLACKQKEFDKFWEKTRQEADVEEPERKRRKNGEEIDPETEFSSLYQNIMNVLLRQIDNRFSTLDSLRFLELVENSSKFDTFASAKFPERALSRLEENYSSFFNIASLRPQLLVIYPSKCMLRGSSAQLLSYLKATGLRHDFSDVAKLCELNAIILATAFGPAKTSPTLNSIKSFVQDVQGQNRQEKFSSVLVVNKELLTKLRQEQDFYDRVIEEFSMKDGSIQLDYK